VGSVAGLWIRKPVCTSELLESGLVSVSVTPISGAGQGVSFVTGRVSMEMPWAES